MGHSPVTQLIYFFHIVWGADSEDSVPCSSTLLWGTASTRKWITMSVPRSCPSTPAKWPQFKVEGTYLVQLRIFLHGPTPIVNVWGAGMDRAASRTQSSFSWKSSTWSGWSYWGRLWDGPSFQHLLRKGENVKQWENWLNPTTSLLESTPGDSFFHWLLA